MKEEIEEVLEKLCLVLNEAELTEEQIKDVTARFLFSIGAGLENCTLQDSEEVLKRYAENPTFGNAMMAQALWMKETWRISKKEKEGKETK